jgi:kinetochor protein Mis14/NSL1
MSSSTSTQPTIPPNPHHRKIDLQSPLDLTYLQTNIRNAASQKLNLHFPARVLDGAGGEDEMRKGVETLVEEFIQRTYALASPSITVNGLDADQLSSTTKEVDEPKEQIEYEAYDPLLATRLSTLYAQLEQLTTRVSGLRRTAPKEAAAAYTEKLRGEIEGEETAFERVVAEEDGADGDGLQVRRPERWEESRGTFGKGLEGMGRLEGLGETVGKVERARGVVDGVGL